MIYPGKCYTTRALEKNAYSAVLDETVCMSINLIWADVIFKASVFLLMFCLNDLSTDVSGMLKFHTVTI